MASQSKPDFETHLAMQLSAHVLSLNANEPVSIAMSESFDDQPCEVFALLPSGRRVFSPHGANIAFDANEDSSIGCGEVGPNYSISGEIQRVFDGALFERVREYSTEGPGLLIPNTDAIWAHDACNTPGLANASSPSASGDSEPSTQSEPLEYETIQDSRETTDRRKFKKRSATTDLSNYLHPLLDVKPIIMNDGTALLPAASANDPDRSRCLCPFSSCETVGKDGRRRPKSFTRISGYDRHFDSVHTRSPVWHRCPCGLYKSTRWYKLRDHWNRKHNKDGSMEFAL